MIIKTCQPHRFGGIYELLCNMETVLCHHVIKNHSRGIHEEEWHHCDLRKKLCAYGDIGSPILSKTDNFLRSPSEYPNHVVNLILGCFSPF